MINLRPIGLIRFSTRTAFISGFAVKNLIERRQVILLFAIEQLIHPSDRRRGLSRWGVRPGRR